MSSQNRMVYRKRGGIRWQYHNLITASDHFEKNDINDPNSLQYFFLILPSRIKCFERHKMLKNCTGFQSSQASRAKKTINFFSPAKINALVRQNITGLGKNLRGIFRFFPVTHDLSKKTGIIQSRKEERKKREVDSIADRRTAHKTFW